MIDLPMILASEARIRPYLPAYTNLEKSDYLSQGADEVYLKLENQQHAVKSFKIRGVLSKLTALMEKFPDKKVITTTISSGNQGVCLSYGTQLLGFPSPQVYVPHTTPQPKIDKMKYLGAMIHFVGQSFDEANQLGGELIQKTGYQKVDSREDEEAVCGQGSIGIEILKQLPDVDAVILPMGSGALSIAVGSYFKQTKPSVMVIGVESERSPAMVENLKTGVWTKFYPVEGSPLLKSLVGGVAQLSFHHARSALDHIVLVSDEEAKQAVADLARYEKTICEPDSAAAYAAYQKIRPSLAGKKTALVLTGANIAPDLFKEVIAQYN